MCFLNPPKFLTWETGGAAVFLRLVVLMKIFDFRSVSCRTGGLGWHHKRFSVFHLVEPDAWNIIPG